VNDYIVFHNVGAYTIVLKPPFIAPAAPILAVSAAGKGKFEVVRRRETFDDVFATYAFDTAPAL
jgi:diaminopimelate decarboxylase